MTSSNDNLRRFLRPTLEVIDEELASRGMPVFRRPLEAACFVVRHVLVSVEGESDKDNFLEKPWFAVIYAETHKWYRRRYGPLLRATDETVSGLLVIRGSPHILNIPLTVSERQENGVLKLTFPIKVSKDEKLSGWLTPRISKRGLGVLSARLGARMERLASGLRAIAVNTRFHGVKNAVTKQMASAVLEHLNRAAQSASSENNGGNSIALWDLHLACEKVVKAYLSQEGISFPRSHDLLALNNLVKDPALLRRAGSIVRRFPNHQEVMRHRYLEAAAIRVTKFQIFYWIAIRVCLVYSSYLKGQLMFNGASFFLKRPPWMS